MDILKFTRSRSNELADYLEECARSPLAFDGDDPLAHSSRNHIELWDLEHFAKQFDWVDLDYKIGFVNYILGAWRNRVKGLPPYQDAGYRFYVFSHSSPTVSVVAETATGFPFQHLLENVEFVDSVADVLALYEVPNWYNSFDEPLNKVHEKVLQVIESNYGSIGKPSAQQLGVKVDELRRLIANLCLDERVNAIRKKYKRRPVNFVEDTEVEFTWYFYEVRLPPKYK